MALSQTKKSMPLQPELVFFLTLLALYLIPLFMTRFFPTQDGPIHMEMARALRDYFFFKDSIYRQYYELNLLSSFNWFIPLITIPLISIFSIAAAEKCLIAGYIILLAFSFRYAVKSLRNEAGWISCLIFPFIYNFYLAMGFYAFCYGLPFFFFSLGYWIRHRQEMGSRFVVLKFILISLLSFLIHPFPFLAGLLAIAAIIFADIVRLVLLKSPSQALFRQNVFLFLIAAISLTSLVTFSRPWLSNLYFARFNGILSGFIWPCSLISESQPLDWSALLIFFVAALGAAGLWIKKMLSKSWKTADIFLALAGVYGFLYFVLPWGFATQGFLNERINIFLFFALILWFSGQNDSVWLSRVIPACVFLFSLIFIPMKISQLRIMDPIIREYTALGAFIRPGTTLLPLHYSHSPDSERKRPNRFVSFRPQPYWHAPGYLAAGQGLINFANYSAVTGGFPLKFRPEMNPKLHLLDNPKSAVDNAPPKVHISKYFKETPGTIDYVLLWQFTEARRSSKFSEDIKNQLKEGFCEIHRSDPQGRFLLYQKETSQA